MTGYPEQPQPDRLPESDLRRPMQGFAADPASADEDWLYQADPASDGRPDATFAANSQPGTVPRWLSERSGWRPGKVVGQQGDRTDPRYPGSPNGGPSTEWPASAPLDGYSQPPSGYRQPAAQPPSYSAGFTHQTKESPADSGYYPPAPRTPADTSTYPSVPRAPADTSTYRNPAPDGHDDTTWAILAYMSAAFFGFGPPLVIYLLRRRNSPFIRAHAIQAVNAAVTLFLYTVCVIVVGGMLALDSVTVAVVTAGVSELLLWLLALLYFFRSTVAASSGDFYRFPQWLCATVLKS